MAPKGIVIGTVLSVLVILWTGAMAQSGCMSELISMMPCLNYVTGSATEPSSMCCSSLANVVQTKPECLCVIVNGGGSSLGINNINQTLALGLPDACDVKTPPSSRCNGVDGPATSPVGSPEGSPQDVSGSKAFPSNGSTTRSNHVLLVANFILFITTASTRPTSHKLYLPNSVQNHVSLYVFVPVYMSKELFV